MCRCVESAGQHASWNLESVPFYHTVHSKVVICDQGIVSHFQLEMKKRKRKPFCLMKHGTHAIGQKRYETVTKVQ